jgi:hypothetical protein
MKIAGFDELQKQLAEAQRALERLDGDLTTVQFNPTDPSSIEAAIQKVEQIIDERIGHYADNPIVAPLVEQSKAYFREKIIEKAAAERLGAKDEQSHE